MVIGVYMLFYVVIYRFYMVIYRWLYMVIDGYMWL